MKCNFFFQIRRETRWYRELYGSCVSSRGKRRWRPSTPDWRRWCCTGPTSVPVPASGSAVWTSWSVCRNGNRSWTFPPEDTFGADRLCMTFGSSCWWRTGRRSCTRRSPISCCTNARRKTATIPIPHNLILNAINSIRDQPIRLA